MLETKSLVYFDLQKTGCTYLAKVLQEILQEKKIHYQKHGIAFTLDTFENIKNNKFSIVTVRNPWDWYVSLWKYGCQESGGFFKYMKAHGFESLYDFNNNKNIQAFQIWLKIVNDTKFIKQCLGAKYRKSGIFKFAGFYSFRYLSLIYFDFINEATNLKSFDDLWEYDLKNNFVNAHLKTHNLEKDLIDFISSLPPNSKIFRKNYKNTIYRISKKEINRSEAHKTRLEFVEYYDDEAKEIVIAREKLFIDKFGFKFDANECLSNKKINIKNRNT